jgi:hypothetical protein
MDDAISRLTQANRKQLDAIEGIAGILDRVADRPKREVVLAKYRQTPPFAMGLEGADDVLDLVQKFQSVSSPDREATVQDLHEREAARNDEMEALTFFHERFSSGGAEVEIEEAERKLASISKELECIKSKIVRWVLAASIEYLMDRFQSDPPTDAHYQIAAWLYQIVTSMTLTKSANDVDVG